MGSFSFEIFYQKAESFDLIIKKFRSSLEKVDQTFIIAFPIYSAKP